MRKTGLGRGLDALLPVDQELLETVVREISVDEIDTNTDQPRKDFDQEALEQLAESIRAMGVLSPILVCGENSRYRIIAGERRYRASRMAGLTTVPCIVKNLSDAEQMEAALVENLQREDLNPMEEAAAIQSLMKTCGYTQDMAAKRLGKSRSAVANTLRLLRLPEEIQALIAQGSITAGHARALLSIEDSEKQMALARQIADGLVTVRDVEYAAEAARQGVAQQAKPQKAPRTLSPEMTELQDHLREAFGLKTAITGSDKQGKIVLTYKSTAELERLYDLLKQILS